MFQLWCLRSFNSRLHWAEAEKNQWDNTQKWVECFVVWEWFEKRIVSSKDAFETKKLVITSFLMKNNLFCDQSIMKICTIEDKINTRVMIDTDSTDYCFVDTLTAQKICDSCKIVFIDFIKSKEMKEYDERRDKIIIQIIYSRLTIQNHIESCILMLIIELRQQAIILDKSWMRKHEMSYHEDSDFIFFRFNHCSHLETLKHLFSFKLSLKKKKAAVSMKINQSVSQARQILRRNEWMFELNRIKTSESELRLKDRGRNFELYEQKKKRETASKEKDSIVSICMIDAVSFVWLIKQKNVKIFSMFIRDINIELNKQNKSFIDSKTKISREYHSWLNVFSKWLADKLFSHRKYDHSIKLIDDVQESDHVLLYSMSEEELILVKRYLEKHLNKDFIVASSTSFASPILFVRKPNEGLRLCADYRKLNAIIKKNRYSLSLINELMTRLFKTKYLTKIDIRHAFNRIRMIIKTDENLITFRIRFEFYKYRVLSFEFINESTTFQNFINDIFMKYLNEFVVTYLNDILVYNNSLKKHREHVKKMLQKLRDAEIQIDIDKCEFHTTETKFLEVIVKRSDIRMNPKKIAAIVE